MTARSQWSSLGLLTPTYNIHYMLHHVYELVTSAKLTYFSYVEVSPGTCSGLSETEATSRQLKMAI